MPSRYEKQIGVGLEPQIIKELEALKAQTGRSVSDLARECVERELPRLKQRIKKRQKQYQSKEG